jgi:hypothetical protein
LFVEVHLDKTELIEAIIQKLFGHFLKWNMPTFNEAYGPRFPKVFSDYFDETSRNLAEARRMLSYHSEHDLNNEYYYLATWRTEGTRSTHPDLITFLGFMKEALPPPWFAGGFCVVGREANFDYWCKMRTWDWDEATALTIGFEPCGRIDKPERDARAHPAVIAFYAARRKLIGNNFFQWGETILLKPSPLSVATWAVEVGLEVPEELQRFAIVSTGETFEGPRSSSATIPTAETIEPRERTSLLKLVIGLAIGGYGYQVDAERSDIPNQIRSDLLQMGLDLHPDTIRRYLREAATILPTDAKTELPSPRARRRMRKAE